MFASTALTAADAEEIKIGVILGFTGPGVLIYPGELAKALKILADGGEIDYVGAAAIELIGSGESAGSYRQVLIKDGKMTTVTYR